MRAPKAAGAGNVPEPHLPHGSIWPFLVTIGITLTLLGVLFMDAGPWLLLLGVAAVVATVIGWVREDHKWWWTNTGTGPGMGRAGTLMFISSEVFIFGALFATYFTFQRMAHDAGTMWPDNIHVAEHLFSMEAIIKVLAFSAVLFASSYTIHKAEKHLFSGRHKEFLNWWGLTIILGAIFVAGQIWEYTSLIGAGLTFGSIEGGGGGQYMTAFYVLTGTHGLHVVGGLTALIFAYLRGRKGQFDEHRHEYPASTAMYWHFVDIVWVIVLTVMYLIPWLTGAGDVAQH